MGIPPLRGLRHLALKVRDIRRAKDFYQKFLGMKIVWEPDPENCYLSSGMDNLALHEDKRLEESDITRGGLDHFGFIADSPTVVDAWAQWATECEVRVVTLPKQHRDGSYSCYVADPDGHTIQILYEPTLSRSGP